MGCGKSTISRGLARKLMFECVDMDDYIEQKEAMSIPEIFETKGESYFRKVEREAIIELSKRENIVVATGGGAAVHFDNMELMNSVGITVYLKVNSGILVSRVMNSHTKRPILDGKSREDMLALVDRMLLEREPFYEKAHIIIDGVNIKVDDVLEEIKQW